MRWALSSPRRSGRVGEQLMLLHVTGRKSGREITVPVAHRPTGDGRLLVLTSATWRVNLRGGAVPVAVTLRGVRVPAVVDLVEDPEAVAVGYRSLVEEVGFERAGRRMSIRINLDRVPSLDELADAARRDGLSLIYLKVAGS